MPTAITSPPAKLNLFLEIPAKRADGYHEIDTVMVAIDWRDELRVTSIPEPVVELKTGWLPSLESVSAELGLDVSDGEPPELLRLPVDRSNLVVAALERFRERIGLAGGFRVDLQKRIPAGAGMGGASSDAAHAIACAALLSQTDTDSEVLREIAAEVGSDVSFFLPTSTSSAPCIAARARGRGEQIEAIPWAKTIYFVVAYPARMLSTAEVYGQLRVPTNPQSADGFLSELERHRWDSLGAVMINRLTQPALALHPPLGELLESMWRSGLEACQLTGSGSACFGIARSAEHALEVTERLRGRLQPGVLLRASETVAASAPVEIVPD
jgi:4-diphosphocytidyl-2-C-methyl-D-erythritol kinase